MKILVSFISVLFLTSLSHIASAQKAGVQFYQGVNKPIISFNGGSTSLDYTSGFNTDTRLGIWVGDLNKVSFSALLGASSVEAVYTDEGISSSFKHSSLLVDIPIRYAFFESPINSISVGPSLGVLMSSSQMINGAPVMATDLFSPINYSLLAEVSFTGYTGEKLKMHPYICYRMMLNNADMDDDKLRINGLSFGLRIDILK
jgi:hypothetical protein